jgi:hypothetical protein
MQKKILLQFFLLLIILIISIIFFKSYFSSDKKVSEIKIHNDEISVNKKDSNLMHNIKYVSSDSEGNNYVITSKYGELKEDEPGLIFMKNVVATINSNSLNPIKISSDNAVYNSVNYHTNFYNNVLMTYEKHNITSNNLDLLFEKNLVTITNDVVYNNLNTKLIADKIEIDLITKNSKIFMNKSSDKVKVVSIN